MEHTEPEGSTTPPFAGVPGMELTKSVGTLQTFVQTINQDALANQGFSRTICKHKSQLLSIGEHIQFKK